MKIIYGTPLTTSPREQTLYSSKLNCRYPNVQWTVLSLRERYFQTNFGWRGT